MCKFLDVGVPNKPFPHENKKGEIVDKFMKTHPVFAQAKKEMLVRTCIAIALLSGTYVLMQKPFCLKLCAIDLPQYIRQIKLW